MTDAQLVDKIKRAKCPSCNTRGRLLPGPFYDRGKLRCQECGAVTQVKT